MADGTVLKSFCEHPRGSFENPLTPRADRSQVPHLRQGRHLGRPRRGGDRGGQPAGGPRLGAQADGPAARRDAKGAGSIAQITPRHSGHAEGGRRRMHQPLHVMAGLSRPKDGVASLACVPAIHVLLRHQEKTWMPGTRAGMTNDGLRAISIRKCWCRRRDLNPRPPAYEADALPLSYAGTGRNRRNCARLNGRGLALASKPPPGAPDRLFEQPQPARAAGRLGFRLQIGRRIGAGIVGHVEQRDHRLDPRRELRRRGADPAARAAQARAGTGSAARGDLLAPAAVRRRRCRRLRSSAGGAPSRRLRSPRAHRPVRPAAPSTGTRRAGRSPATPASSDRTRSRRRSRPDRAARAARAPSIRGRGLRRRSRAPRSRPSASATRWVGSFNSGRSAFARHRELLRVERGARHRQRALDMAALARRLQRQRLHAREPLARGIARAQMRVGVGEIGMRIGRPRLLDDAAWRGATRRPRRAAGRPAPRPARASARASPHRAPASARGRARSPRRRARAR